MWTLTEQHDVDGPIVYGYLRLHRSTPERHAALTVALAQYCEQHELQLCGIFTDRGAASSDDPAFAASWTSFSCPAPTGWFCPLRTTWARSPSRLGGGNS
ncbi:hypothetical protein ACFQX6_43930 [Streptosporangium lutulentum]